MKRYQNTRGPIVLAIGLLVGSYFPLLAQTNLLNDLDLLRSILVGRFRIYLRSAQELYGNEFAHVGRERIYVNWVDSHLRLLREQLETNPPDPLATTDFALTIETLANHVRNYRAQLGPMTGAMDQPEQSLRDNVADLLRRLEEERRLVPNNRMPDPAETKQTIRLFQRFLSYFRSALRVVQSSHGHLIDNAESELILNRLDRLNQRLDDIAEAVLDGDTYDQLDSLVSPFIEEANRFSNRLRDVDLEVTGDEAGLSWSLEMLEEVTSVYISPLASRWDHMPSPINASVAVCQAVRRSSNGTTNQATPSSSK